MLGACLASGSPPMIPKKRYQQATHLTNRSHSAKRLKHVFLGFFSFFFTMLGNKKEEDGASEGDGSPAPQPKRLRVSPSPPRWSNAKGQQSPCHNPFHAHPVFASVSTPLYLMFGPHERDILSLHRESAIGYPLNDIEPVHTCFLTLS